MRKMKLEKLIGTRRNSGLGGTSWRRKRRKRRRKREIRRKEEKTYKSIPTWYSSTFPSSILSRYRQMAL
jgi:hypothetical protein